MADIAETGIHTPRDNSCAVQILFLLNTVLRLPRRQQSAEPGFPAFSRCQGEMHRAAFARNPNRLPPHLTLLLFCPLFGRHPPTQAVATFCHPQAFAGTAAGREANQRTAADGVPATKAYSHAPTRPLLTLTASQSLMNYVHPYSCIG